jgi:predicted branched-subunit amino acid permease
MMRFFRPNGSALLTLVAALVLATWPFFGTFTMGAIVAGFFLSLWMRSWHTQHPSTVSMPERPLHSEINMAAIPVRGDGAGLLFAVGSVVTLLALPQLRWFLIASVVCSVIAGGVLIAWRSRTTSGLYEPHPILGSIR